MAKRVLFVPFKLPGKLESPGYEYISKNNLWIRIYQEKKAAIDDEGVHAIWQVFYHDGKRSALLASLGEDDQLYVRAHSLAGFEGVFDHTDHDEQGRIIHQSRMNRDLFYKLNPSAQSGGRRIAFSLHAPEVVRRLDQMGLQKDFEGAIKCYNCHSAEGEANFATALARALTNAGYTDCSVYGYKGALSSFYDGDHKTSTRSAKKPRASQQRVQIR